MRVHSALLAIIVLTAAPTAAEEPVTVAAVDAKPPQRYAQVVDTGTANVAPPVEARAPVPPRVMYRPPAVGKPARTVGGGSRGATDKIPSLFAIVPDHVAKTASPQPALFWYVDRVPDASTRVEFTLHDEEGEEPLVQVDLETPTSAGLQRIRLSEHGANLVPGAEYEWSVALVIDPDQRSKDIVVTGWIDCVDPSPTIVSRLELQGEAWRAAIFAEEGVWYDAFAALSDQIDRDPKNPLLTKQRSDLLDQAGLDLAAGRIGG